MEQGTGSRRCPDSGVCHHDGCRSRGCFRVQTCAPLSGVFPDNKWPVDVVIKNRRPAAGALTVDSIPMPALDTVKDAGAREAVDYAALHGDTDNIDHKTWIIDQMMYALLGETAYRQFVDEFNAGSNNPWETGRSPL